LGKTMATRMAEEGAASPFSTFQKQTAERSDIP
jgi:hypothetical protein